MLSTNNSLQDVYPTLAHFAQVSLSLPVSNADSERGFSCVNRIKTELRNRLTVSSVDSLVRISSQRPSAQDFNFERALLYEEQKNYGLKHLVMLLSA